MRQLFQKESNIVCHFKNMFNIQWTETWIILINLYLRYTSKRVETGKMYWSDNTRGEYVIDDVNEWSCVDPPFRLFDDSYQLVIR